MHIMTRPSALTPGRSVGRLLLHRDHSPPTGRTQPIRLWPHQRAAIAATHDAIRRGVPAGLLAMPCGCGKTFTFVTLARDLDRRTLILVHRDELVGQTRDTLETIWPDASVGVIKAKRDEWCDDQRVVVASVQSLRNGRLDRMPCDRFQFIIADECHHAVAKTWRAIIDHFHHDFLLGVTATPERLDGQGLSGMFGPRPLYAYPLRQAILDRVLVPLRQYGVNTHTSLEDVSTRAGDFATGELSAVINTPARNAIVVDAYLKHAAERRAVVFAVDVAHAEALAEKFTTAGIKTAMISGATPIDERRETLAAFRRGGIHVVCNCEVLTEGFDDRGVSAILMARPTQSRALYTQCIGRSLRRCDEEGKEDAVVIDFGDNARKHKLITALDLFGTTDKRDAAGVDVIDFVDRELAEREQKLLIDSLTPVEWRLERVCPWPEYPSLRGYVEAYGWHSQPASERQVTYLRSFGLHVTRALTKGECGYLLDRALEFRAAYPSPPTTNQEWFLRRRHAWSDDMTFDDASRRIRELKS